VRRFLLTVVIVIGALAALEAADFSSPATLPFQVVAHPEVEGTRIPRATLSSVFLKEVVRSGDGELTRPVDQSMSSPLRAEFTEQVLTVPVDGIQRFWHRRIMKGISPPPVRSSDEAVLKYVAGNQGAIGYVSAGTALPAGVKALEVVD
jgi:hypothetical protein